MNEQIQTKLKDLRAEFSDIPNDGNNMVLKRLLIMNTRMYEHKKLIAEQINGSPEHAILLEDLSSMVEHINSYRNLLGLNLL
jgi:hypothetical protein